jgi:methylated-DNA-protein-cysteine methyltransferase-like protein
MHNPPDIDQRIWQVVALIPPGRVATYGEVARQAGLSGAARRVGRALGTLPVGTRIPWHRVINARGRLSLPEGSAGHHTQRERLEGEGVAFRTNGSIDLRRFGWRPGVEDPER